MKRVAPGCKAACDGRPAETIDELIAAFKRLRVRGKTVEQLYLIAGDANQIAGLFPSHSMGALHAIATAPVSEDCAACAVTAVIEEENAKAYETHFPDEFTLGAKAQKP